MLKEILSCAWLALSITLAPAVETDRTRPASSSRPSPPPTGCELCTDKAQPEPADQGSGVCAVFTFTLLSGSRGTCVIDDATCKADRTCSFDYRIELKKDAGSCCTNLYHTIETGTVSPPNDTITWLPPTPYIPSSPFPESTITNHQIPCTNAWKATFWGECSQGGQVTMVNLGGFSLTCSYCK